MCEDFDNLIWAIMALTVVNSLALGFILTTHTKTLRKANDLLAKYDKRLCDLIFKGKIDDK